ncbi:keto-deoxy-phosphogluconate aldolase [Pseudoalteromonas sp. A601]|uniref:bifunctional 4-hydroxy-2-oxoglutarate aldolase/2-dehydro-3-deoxy-phosphogluconate aldolase n=1 Tax=Pseudoalteromonas sp. A601 TaxID=1967839 RepID=UPI000B3BE1A0|nr:bifunctional 4-hydroxy-2-oxoglutarate aldolase/2-dehydro-3-deoxy-phosphogluconate aldolase [Pseudoalteromonas sp. A601]OUS70355.1 keto-deoxy-phosphogluconate aldolase [Pseudoalteromonas sp. A601]
MLFSEYMAGQKLLPIIQTGCPETGVAITKAMHEGGVNLVEVVLRHDTSLSVLSAIKEAFPDLKVGAGTVIDSTILADALKAGADYIVTPAVTPKLLEALVDCGVPVLPGVSSTSDITLAREAGFKEMKLFPANLAGGINFLNTVKSVYRDCQFCPTGGINEKNVGDFLALTNVFAAGGTWVSAQQWIDDKNWQAITEACQQVV